MRFCTVINCMDGRVQLPVIGYLQNRFNVEYVDSVTEAGPNLILSEGEKFDLINSIHQRLRISIENHNSVGIAIVGHHDCAGNPAPEEEQSSHINQALQILRQEYKDLEIIGLWVDENLEVHEIPEQEL